MIAAKTTTCANLGIGLAREGKRVLRSASQSNTQLGMEETGKSVSDTGYAHGQSSSETNRSCSKAALTYSIQRGMRELARRIKKF